MVLYLGSLSKTLSPGLRIGWVVAPEPVIERLADIKMQNDYGSSSVSQWASAEWLGRGLYKKHLVFVREQLKVRLTVQLLTFYFTLKMGILLNPGTIYHRNAGNYLRIPFVYAKPNELEWGLERLAGIIKSMMK